jgi:hypothetical protein
MYIRQVQMRTIRVAQVEEGEQRAVESASFKSCCFHIDKRAIVLFMQILVSLMTTLFSIYMLFIEKDCNRATPFWALLSSSIAIWLPAPYQK